jgi:hypothetical protein
MPRTQSPTLTDLLSVLNYLPAGGQEGGPLVVTNQLFHLRERLIATISAAYEGQDQSWMAQATLARAKARWRKRERRQAH